MSVNDKRLSPAWTEHAPGPSTSGNWRVCRRYGRSVVDRRRIVRQRWALTADGCTQHCRCQAVTKTTAESQHHRERQEGEVSKGHPHLWWNMPWWVVCEPEAETVSTLRCFPHLHWSSIPCDHVVILRDWFLEKQNDGAVPETLRTYLTVPCA